MALTEVRLTQSPLEAHELRPGWARAKDAVLAVILHTAQKTVDRPPKTLVVIRFAVDTKDLAQRDRVEERLLGIVLLEVQSERVFIVAIEHVTLPIREEDPTAPDKAIVHVTLDETSLELP